MSRTTRILLDMLGVAVVGAPAFKLFEKSLAR